MICIYNSSKRHLDPAPQAPVSCPLDSARQPRAAVAGPRSAPRSLGRAKRQHFRPQKTSESLIFGRFPPLFRHSRSHVTPTSDQPHHRPGAGRLQAQHPLRELLQCLLHLRHGGTRGRRQRRGELRVAELVEPALEPLLWPNRLPRS